MKHGNKTFSQFLTETRKTAEQLNSSIAKRRFRRQITLVGDNDHVSNVVNGSIAHDTFLRQIGLKGNVKVDDIILPAVGKVSSGGKKRKTSASRYQAGALGYIPHSLHTSEDGKHNARTLNIPKHGSDEYNDALKMFPPVSDKENHIKDSIMTYATHRRLEASGYKRVNHNNEHKLNPGEYYIQNAGKGLDLMARTHPEEIKINGKKTKTTHLVGVDTKYRKPGGSKSPNPKISAYFNEKDTIANKLVDAAVGIVGDESQTLTRKKPQRAKTIKAIDDKLQLRGNKNASSN